MYDNMTRIFFLHVLKTEANPFYTYIFTFATLGVIILLHILALYSVLKNRNKNNLPRSSTFFICIVIYLGIISSLYNLEILSIKYQAMSQLLDVHQLLNYSDIDFDALSWDKDSKIIIKLGIYSDHYLNMYFATQFQIILKNIFNFGLFTLSLNQFFIFYCPQLNSKIFMSNFVYVFVIILSLISFFLTAVIGIHGIYIILAYDNLLSARYPQMEQLFFTFLDDSHYFKTIALGTNYNLLLFVTTLFYFLIILELRFKLTWRIKSGKDFFKPVINTNSVQRRSAWSLAAYCFIMIVAEYAYKVVTYSCEMIYGPNDDHCNINSPKGYYRAHMQILSYVFTSNSFSFLIALMNTNTRETFVKLLK